MHHAPWPSNCEACPGHGALAQRETNYHPRLLTEALLGPPYDGKADLPDIAATLQMEVDDLGLGVRRTRTDITMLSKGSFLVLAHLGNKEGLIRIYQASSSSQSSREPVVGYE